MKNLFQLLFVRCSDVCVCMRNTRYHTRRSRSPLIYSAAKLEGHDTYGGLDKESLVHSRVFLMERWSMSRECVENKCPSCLECSKAEGNDHGHDVYGCHVQIATPGPVEFC
ncbi:hypothetical protein Taro_051650 [Colocasia esculenta]|uniref:Uncharacterized protein n=1 Tax=Colocasia esculenta TaxID=4460 RepID=A0A843XGI7_COLES|nr:hypothetical protein [Colocasia esculenta]